MNTFQYGYSLPKSKDGILFYEIKFPIPRSNIFIYPSLCVTSGPLDIIPNRDKEVTITHFLSDMLVKVPIICGQQLQISKHTPFKTENISLATSTFIKSQGLDTCLIKENDPIRILQSGISEIRNTNTNITSVSLKEQLTKIHEIHNTSVRENVAHSSNRAIDENRNDATQTTEGGFIGGNASRNLADTFTDDKIDIEAMAKNNQLHQVQKSVLSNWLKKHLIPHDLKAKKTDLINKVLSHIRNTQMSHQFRL